MSELYSPGQVATLLHVSRRTVERLIRKGELRSAKVGGQRRITKAELERYVNVAEQRGRVI